MVNTIVAIKMKSLALDVKNSDVTYVGSVLLKKWNNVVNVLICFESSIYLEMDFISFVLVAVENVFWKVGSLEETNSVLQKISLRSTSSSKSFVLAAISFYRELHQRTDRNLSKFFHLIATFVRIAKFSQR